MSPFTSYALFVVFGSTAIIFQGCDPTKKGNVLQQLRQQLKPAGKEVTTTGATATTTSNAPTDTTAATTTTTTTTTPSLIDVIVQLILNQLNVEDGDVDLVNELKQELKLEQQLKQLIEQYEVDDDEVRQNLQRGINELEKLVDIADEHKLVEKKAALDALGFASGPAYALLEKTLSAELKKIKLGIEVDWDEIAAIIVELVQQLEPKQLQKIFTGIKHVVDVGTWILAPPHVVSDDDELKLIKLEIVEQLEQLKRTGRRSL